MENIRVFEEWAREYDGWFDKNKLVYESELEALKRFVPKKGRGLEVGVGTGRFAAALGIRVGVEPAEAMAAIAHKRGLKAYKALAEELPFDSESFDFVLLVTTICFLENPVQALQEAHRVLKPAGKIVIGMIDKNSPLGRMYESRKGESKFYKYAKFYSVSQVLEWLGVLEFANIRTCQTIFKNPEEITAIEPVKDGYGEGGFVVICAQKEVRS